MYDQVWEGVLIGLGIPSRGGLDLFMDAMAHPPDMADALWELVKLKMKKGAPKAPEPSSKSIFNKP